MDELDELELRRLAEATKGNELVCLGEGLGWTSSNEFDALSEAVRNEPDTAIKLILSLLDQIQESRREGFNEGVEESALKIHQVMDAGCRTRTSLKKEIRKLKQD